MRHLLRELTASEIVEWESLYRIDPWGEQRADLRSAIVAWTIASAHSKKGHKPKLENFMPSYEKAFDNEQRRKYGQADKDFAMNLLAWHGRLGGTGEPPQALVDIALGKTTVSGEKPPKK